MSSSKQKEPGTIVVVGAGVIGLSSALVLKQNGYENVIIVAENFPNPEQGGDSPYYTSTKAGAHFRPFPSKTESDVRESGYTRKTLKYFGELVKSHPESSIKFVRGYDWIDDPSPEYKELQIHYTKEMNNFNVLDTKGLPEGVTFACGYDTYVLNAPLYVAFLYRRLLHYYGVKFVQKKLGSLSEVFSLFPGKEISGIVNATATGLQYDGSLDPLCFPIRGQTLLLRVPPDCPYLDKTITHQNMARGEWTFVIGRPLDGGLILGGTKQVGSTVAVPLQQDIDEVTNRARKIFPDLFAKESGLGGETGLDVIKVNVGFRPARKNGSRVELEMVKNPKSAFIVHAYGIGGMGFESSYGMALHVFDLIEKHNSLHPKL